MIYTSYFNCKLLKEIPLDKQIAISIGIRGWYHGKRELRLAPTRAMLKMSRVDYYANYDIILAKVDPAEIAKLYDGCVLICWEKDPQECHRHYVAEWLQKAGYEVQELTAGSVTTAQQMFSL